MTWALLQRLRPEIWAAVGAFALVFAVLIAWLARIRQRLSRLTEELNANEDKLRDLFAEARQVSSSNGNAILVKGENTPSP